MLQTHGNRLRRRRCDLNTANRSESVDGHRLGENGGTPPVAVLVEIFYVWNAFQVEVGWPSLLRVFSRIPSEFTNSRTLVSKLFPTTIVSTPSQQKKKKKKLNGKRELLNYMRVERRSRKSCVLRERGVSGAFVNTVGQNVRLETRPCEFARFRRRCYRRSDILDTRSGKLFAHSLPFSKEPGVCNRNKL